MFYAVYELATGALRSVGSVVADPLPDGLAALELSGAPDFGAVAWDPATRAFAPRPPAVELSAEAFRERFTFAERVAIKQAAAADARVAVLMEDVGAKATIRLTHPRTVSGLGLLQLVGAVTPERAAEILDPAWTPSEAA
jgi:hypothetical protein